MNKRGQITIFIIAALVIMLGASLLFYFLAIPGQEQDTYEQAIDKSIVASAVDNCLKETGTEAIYLVSTRGGAIYESGYMFYGNFQQITYSIYDNKSVAVSKSFIEDEISRYVEDTLDLCMNYFHDFKDYDFEVDEPYADTRISDDYVRIELNYPIKMIDGERSTSINYFASTIPIRLGKTLNIRDQMIDHLMGTSSIDMGFFSLLELPVVMVPYDGSTTVYAINDEQSDIRDTDYVFHVAERREFQLNPMPEIEKIRPKTAFIGEQFYLKVDAYDGGGDILGYFDDTYLFDIDKSTGEISFTPWTGDKGNYTIEISARDRQYRVKTRFNLTIKER